MNKKKYINALLFFIKNCNNKKLTLRKISYLFYYLDFICYRDHKKSVTKEIYLRVKYGIKPVVIEFIISKAIELDLIKIYKEKYFLLKKPNLTCFNSYEKDLLNKICKKFKNYSEDKMSDQIIFEAPCFYARAYCKVNYNYSYDIDII